MPDSVEETCNTTLQKKRLLENIFFLNYVILVVVVQLSSLKVVAASEVLNLVLSGTNLLILLSVHLANIHPLTIACGVLSLASG